MNFKVIHPGKNKNRVNPVLLSHKRRNEIGDGRFSIEHEVWGME
jgi:hypothetical protein